MKGISGIRRFYNISHKIHACCKINGISCTIEAVFKDSSPTEGTVFSRKVISTCIIATYTTFSPPILSQKHIVFVTKCFQIFNYKLPQVPLIRYLWQFIEHLPPQIASLFLIDKDSNPCLYHSMRTIFIGIYPSMRDFLSICKN